MHFDVKTVHFSSDEDTKEYIDKKMHRVGYAKEYLKDLHLTLTKEKTNFYAAEANFSFTWGLPAHIKVESYDLLEGLDTLFDKMDLKIKKEKGKIQQH